MIAFLKNAAKFPIIFYLFGILSTANGVGYNQTRRGNAEERSGHFQGDILVNHDLHTRNGLADESLRWPNKELPFVIASGYTPEQIDKIYEAADIINESSCVYLRPKKILDRHYVEIRDTDQGCSSFIGFQNNGKQEMNLGQDCFQIGTVIHEFLHCLGFIHQHSSPERDEYITINYDNIDPEMQSNFDAYTDGPVTDFGIEYDPFSVMHYSEYAFSINEEKTIELKDGIIEVADEKMIGQREGLTESDTAKLNLMYQC